MSSAHVLSIQALEEFKGHLTRFNAQAQEILNATEIEIRRTLDWLHERLNYWRNEVNRRREIYHRALAAYQRCLESRRMRDKNGNVIQLPCPAEEAAVERARRHLAEAQAELRTVQEWMQRFQQAVNEYERQARRLKAWLDGELPKATAFLERKITTLHSYVAMGISSGAYVASPPTQAMGGTSVSEALPAWQFEGLGSGTNARYDAERDAILLDSRLQAVREPMLLAPLLAHEAVHRRYRSDPPHDEASLRRYVDEEMEAYRAQRDAWLQVKGAFEERYPDPAAMLNEVERDLLSDHLQLEQALQDEDAFRASRMDHYRQVMAARQNEER